MPLQTGARLGIYEVIAPLGAGGMGEVYRARDPRLGREVAIKVLPADMSADTERVKRFEKEARSASALNHPNIVTIYDAGSDGGISWIAMELVEGQTLRQLISSGPLSVRRLQPIATQMVRGLARAHEAGIVHRDLKPENVMVTRDGLVKILDFGLAKLTGPVSGGDQESQLPTMTGTSPGVVMGTVGYMSPEQAAGHMVDYRSDQFALGSIVYEMTTGKRAFERKTAVDTLAAILNDEPDPIASAAPAAPAPLRWVVERCLAKEPEARYSSTDDLAKDLEALGSRLAEPADPRRASTGPPRGRSLRWLALSLLPAALVAALLLGWRRPAPPAPPRFQKVTFRRGAAWRARFTPDSQTVVYAMRSIGADLQPAGLYSVRVGNLDTRALDLPPADILSISPSGMMAILQTAPDLPLNWGTGTLAEVSVAGGTPRQLLEPVNSADWSPDGRELAVCRIADGKVRLEFPVGKVLHESPALGYARVSPDGRLVAFQEYLPGKPGAIRVVNLSGEVRTLVADVGEAGGTAWSPKGDEVFWMKVAHHDSLGQVQTSEVHAAGLSGRDRVVIRLPGDFALHDVSRDGRVLVEQANQTFEMVAHFPGHADRSLEWLDQSIPVDLSPDGSTLLFADRGDAAGFGAAVYLRRTDGAPAVRLGEGLPLALSPDGKWALASRGTNNPELTRRGLGELRLVLMPTGAGTEKVLPAAGVVFNGWAAFHPDGKRIFFSGFESGHNPRGFEQALDGSPPRAVTKEGLTPLLIAPDGGSLLVRNEEDWAISMVPSDPAARAEPRSLGKLTLDDNVVRWSADGASIFVWRENTRPMEVDRIDVATGKRAPWKAITPGSLLGSGGMKGLVLTADTQGWVAGYNSWFSDLLVIDGLK